MKHLLGLLAEELRPNGSENEYPPLYFSPPRTPTRPNLLPQMDECPGNIDCLNPTLPGASNGGEISVLSSENMPDIDFGAKTANPGTQTTSSGTGLGTIALYGALALFLAFKLAPTESRGNKTPLSGIAPRKKKSAPRKTIKSIKL